jgi:predicted RNA-binding protein with PIN domain
MPLEPMPIIRILVDGYSLLHAWPGLAARASRHSAEARDELIHRLIEYQAASGTPVTVFFDGQGSAGKPRKVEGPGIEVLYSSTGQTADELIERAAYRFRAYGEVLVVTDDGAERETVTGFGALASSCATFIAQLESERDRVALDLRTRNRRELDRYRRGN